LERAVNKLTLFSAFVGGILVGAVGWLVWPEKTVERSAAELMDVVMWNKEPIGGPFALIDHAGQPRTDADFRGKLLLIYFGFTYCSDACPTDLQAIATALDNLGPIGEAVQPLFITVDPEKDSPEQLKAHVALFHPRLIGLTGDREQIRNVTSAYKVYFAKAEPSNGANPNIDHSGFTFLVDAGGKYLGFFPPGTSADLIVQVIRPKLVSLVQR
jgi:cytochrome oxidase Cu insertion factor (SCO1/SenC/PrrC family)